MNQTIRSFASISYRENLSSADIGFDDFNFLPYGRQIKHVEAWEKMSEAFTTKDFDEEVGVNLNYFGARYCDPDVALWTSVDAMRQHHSPYTYGSNNPVNRVDPDGNPDITIIKHNQGLQNKRVNSPGIIPKINQIAGNMHKEVNTRIKEGDLPQGNPYQNEADAYRHIRLNQELTKEFGSFTTLLIGWQYELKTLFDIGDTSALDDKLEDGSMDLHNNKLGRENPTGDALLMIDMGKASVLNPQRGGNHAREYEN